MEPWAEKFSRAMEASARSIAPNRRRLSDDDARTIVLESFASHGYPMPPVTARSIARNLLHPYWTWLHPIRARREGWRFTWRWAADDD
jgi:hypothetical protein